MRVTRDISKKLCVTSEFIKKHTLKQLKVYEFNAILRKEATSALVGFHVAPLSISWSSLEMFCLDGRKRRIWRKTLGGENQRQTQPHMVPGRNRTRATLVRVEQSHHCAITTSHLETSITAALVYVLVKTSHVTQLRSLDEVSYVLS